MRLFQSCCQNVWNVYFVIYIKLLSPSTCPQANPKQTLFRSSVDIAADAALCLVYMRLCVSAVVLHKLISSLRDKETALNSTIVYSIPDK